MVCGFRWCECNTAASPLIRGSNMSIAVRARNAIGWSKFSTSASVKIMGRPSATGVTAAVEQDNGLMVTWDPPKDTGFGESASDPAVITAYTLILTMCLDTRGKTDELCSMKRFTVAPPSDASLVGTEECDKTDSRGLKEELYCEAPRLNVTKLIEAQGNLVEGIIYYLKVTARNAVGPSFESQSPPFRAPYRIYPW
jgi:hypothetical protein